MNLAVVSFEPIARTEYLDRFGALPGEPLLAPEDWVHVDEEVQEELAFLEAEVRRKLPDVCVQACRTKGKAFFLFSYRTFSTPEGLIDPVVANVTFSPANPGVTVEADISGEHIGDILSATPGVTVDCSRDDISAAARAAARSLRGNAGLIVAALQDVSRTVE